MEDESWSMESEAILIHPTCRSNKPFQPKKNMHTCPIRWCHVTMLVSKHLRSIPQGCIQHIRAMIADLPWPTEIQADYDLKDPCFHHAPSRINNCTYLQTTRNEVLRSYFTTKIPECGFIQNPYMGMWGCSTASIRIKQNSPLTNKLHFCTL